MNLANGAIDAQAEEAAKAAQRPEPFAYTLRSQRLVAGIIPGVERQSLKELAADENDLLKLLERWRAEAEKAGHKITRIAVAFETGRDGFWLARWLRKRGIEAHVIHAASDTEQL
jgi:hypothetical protein